MVTLLLGALAAVAFALDREQHRASRAAHRRSKEALDALAPADRRAVGRSVRRGQAVPEPRLAPAAVALAEAVNVGRVRWWSSVNSAAFIVWLTVPALAASLDHRWGVAAALWIGPVFFLVIFGIGISLRHTAGAALEANRRLLEAAGWPRR